MRDATVTNGTAPRRGRRRLVLCALLVVGVVALARYLNAPAYLQVGLQWLQGLGLWGWALFVLLYIATAVLLLPAVVLTLGAGAVYGVAQGWAIVTIAATLAATAAFLIGRYLARGWVARRIEGNPMFAAIDDAVAREGWKIVGLTRLSPAFPFNLLNYAYGVTRVSLRHYILASLFGMMPGTLMYVYLGSLAGDLANIGAGQHARTPVEWIYYLVGLLATVAVTVMVTRIARSALRRRIAT
ncbi:MAG: TVP38/TMEM64 family protein [Zetaproteobacteria bacterium]|nr:MAG: TVP38/TMEM64 family protein [Zetaproteobacteria bacterium]